MHAPRDTRRPPTGGAATARHARPVVAWSCTRARGSRDGGHRWRRGNRTRLGRSALARQDSRAESREDGTRHHAPRAGPPGRGARRPASNNKLNIANSYDNIPQPTGRVTCQIAQSQTRILFRCGTILHHGGGACIVSIRIGGRHCNTGRPTRTNANPSSVQRAPWRAQKL